MLRDPRMWLGALSLAVVVTLFVLDTERASPGPLTSTHADADGLAGNAGCVECHGERGETMAAACAQCHAEVAEQLAQGRGFHGTREDVDVARCELCHLEHHGDEIELVDQRAFTLAGVADAQRFDHGHVAFALSGVHTELACKECHANADAARLADGETRFLGLGQDCEACHEDPHEGRFARGCASCHGQDRPFKELGNFAHTEDLPLVGGHADLDCAKCHAPGSAQSVEALGGPGPKPAARTCIDCHASPHTPSFARAVAAALGVAESASCVRCHAHEAVAFTGEQATMPPGLHAATGFALTAPHERARCVDCHGEQPKYEQRYRARIADDCAACHADPHGAQFDGAGVRARCVDCHAAEHFKPSKFELVAHARAGFPLDAAHAKAACNDCHTQDGDAPRVYRTTPTSCAACHDDVHGGVIADAAGQCATCHTPTRFADARFTPPQHLAATRFDLRGAHARAECESCHARAPRPDERGRSFGLAAAQFHGPLGECATCHRDVHQGAFDGRDLLALVDGRGTCARCHGEERFGDLLMPFDHARWTSFALEGAHAKASCASCHGTMPDARAAGRTLGRVADAHPGPSSRCDTCHADVHAGAFARVERDVDCDRCHTTQTFVFEQRATYDHTRWGGFTLEGAHAGAACEACHVPKRERDAQGRRFSPAAGTACSDCHVDPHASQFALAGATDCARCHSSTGAFELVGFDHDRDTRFALDVKHAKLACAVCHVPWPTSTGEKVVRYRPLGLTCVECHGFERGGGRK